MREARVPETMAVPKEVEERLLVLERLVEVRFEGGGGGGGGGGAASCTVLFRY